jgi:NADH-quinone oxidoreductase subunit L
MVVEEIIQAVTLSIILLPLLGTLSAGLLGQFIGRSGAHWVTNLCVGAAFVLSCWVFNHVVIDQAGTYNQVLYTWMVSDGISFNIGFLVDELSSVMLVVVTFVSFMVHIYTIGYMKDDPGYIRFFSYISLFTFSMLMLVLSNNFLQLFFGWEAVGLVSYLLIGFWFDRDSAIYANLKAFLVNRVGDFGFLLGIAAVLMYFNSLDYATVFAKAPELSSATVSVIPGLEWSVITLICILLFVGAMGKSAQVPLHVWLPDSMEGPTPISALIHAATMVTAGIFMVARMSPLFELSTTALSVVMVIGAITALFMGFLGIIQHDIKRVVAYSTLSQLGYMTVALGASAYAGAVFHLMTHAFFKALLFLGAGSVIIALHHEQDMRKMGGLARYLPITYITMLIGTLALIGFPGFAGFFSKDAIIEAVHLSQTPGAGFAWVCVLLGVFVTSFYSFRLLFMVFHGKTRMDDQTKSHVHESPWVVTVPLVLLAIPSILAGAWFVEPMLMSGLFGESIQVASNHDVLAQWTGHFQVGSVASGMLSHGFFGLPFWLALSGAVLAWYLVLYNPVMAGQIKSRFHGVYALLDKKYGFDDFNDTVFARGARGIGYHLWKLGDVRVIDGWLVNGSAALVGWFSSVVRQMQTGYMYHYAFVMIFSLLIMLIWIML